MADKYIQRLIDAKLQYKVPIFGYVSIRGCRWCGKSTTAKTLAKSCFDLRDPKVKENNLELAYLAPSLALKGKKPRLIKEWQEASFLWDAIRYDVDRTSLGNQYILTGSAFPMVVPFHSGAGRVARMTMRPMSLYESRESTGEVSLASLFEKKIDVRGKSSLSLEDLAFIACRGGWPEAVKQGKTQKALNLTRCFYEQILTDDISEVDGVKRNSKTAREILRSYANNVGRQVSYEQIRKDILAENEISICSDTVHDYIEAFRKIYVIEDSPSYSMRLHSKAINRRKNTGYFVDPSVVALGLEMSPSDLVNNPKAFYAAFRNLVIRDLRIYADIGGGYVAHYRNSNDYECEIVTRGSYFDYYGLIKICLDYCSIDMAAESLKSIQNDINTERLGSPAFLMVLSSDAQYAYKREDDVVVCPIGCLKP